ncbi:MAG: beta strand repeat-containing protein, partial [Terriglobales bacterium]
GAASGAITVTDAAGTQTAGLSGQGTAPGLAITPAFANFGAATVGATSAAQTLTVTNTGTAAVTLAAVAVTGDFSTVTTCSTSAALASGASCLVGVSFTPSATGLRTGGVSVSSAGGITASAVVVGTGTEPGISAAPAALAFGSQAVGVASAAQTVTVTNTGTAPLTVASITTSGDFAEADNCTATPLAAGASCVVNVTMSASTTGSRTGTLNIYDDADGLHPVALSGVGAAATVQLAPTQLAFGSQPIPGANIAVAGSPQTVVLTNSGNAALAIASIAASGAYTQTNTCGASLAANTSCTISVTFAPTLEGQQTGALVITDNASGSPSQSVALAGIGSPNGLVLAPPVLAFGGAAVGVTSAAQTATLSNNTGAAISSLAISASGELSETDNCGTSLATGASCTVNVTVTPVLPGAITGTISIGGAIAAVGGGAHRAFRAGDPLPRLANPNQRQLAAVAISGGGSPAGLGLSPQTVNFAAQAVGVASAAQTLTLSNTGAAQVSGLTVASSPDFPYTTTCGATLAGNANCTINLTFKPTAAGARTGMLSMAASGGLSASVALSGQATGSTLAAAPSALTFAPLPPATASAPQTVTLTASGAAVNLQTIAVAGAGYALGASTCGTLPASLASGSSCTVQVIYTPAAIGTQAGTLTVTSDASNGAVVVGLSGSGSSASGSLTASPSTVTFAAQGVDHASSAQTVTLNNATGAAVPVAISVTGTNAADFSQTSTCGASLATGSSCTVAVVFTPAGAGARSATLVVAGTAGISVPLAGAGSDFSLTAANPAAITAGQTATVPLTLASLAGDSQTVTLACSVSGAGTGCTVAPASVALNGTTTAQASVLVTTTPPQFGQGETPLLPPAGLPSNGHGDLLWWLAAAALLGIAIRQRRRWKVMLAASAFAACVACGGISNQPISNGTGQSTLTVTVTATSSTGVVHTTTATVQVTARQ